MATLQEQIDAILANRKERLAEIEAKQAYWENLSSLLDKLNREMQAAEKLNDDQLRGTAEKIRHISQTAHDEENRFRRMVERFGRNDICIGIGGAGRMGKSTFLQSVTGLGEDQIPTSDKYYTTAGRSLIVNSATAVAIADMHNERSFLEKVIAPMCRSVKLVPPSSLNEFDRMKVELPPGEETTQAKLDVVARLQDTRKALPTIKQELTGERNRHIDISALRDYVAYPDGGKSKAGKFMAVANIVVYAPFPDAEVKQLRVVDLPGLGEAGRDLAEVQTTGMSDICDITLLMKRPVQGNVAWMLFDTNALDAMRAAAPLLDDQTKYTVILANVGGETQEMADACVEQIENNFRDSGRTFEIIRCNARDRKSVLSKTMPEILKFLARNLPEIDKAIFEKAAEEAKKSMDGISSALNEVKQALSPIVNKNNGNLYTFQSNLYDDIVKSLSEYARQLRTEANKPDEAWNKEVLRVTETVKAWVNNGCGYNSKENLKNQIAQEILANKGQPIKTVNQLRIAFREQWEVIDEHLQSRIANVLDGFILAIKEKTNSFVPVREEKQDKLAAIREQLVRFADKLLHAPDQQPGDEVALQGLAAPLLRLSEFDLRFRFHLEPTLIAATEVLVSNKLPLASGPEDAPSFTEGIMQMLIKTADDYSKTMCASRAGNAAIEKKKRLIEGAVKDPAVCKELIALLENAVSASQSFNPNRIFAAVIENAVDAFLRFQNNQQAFIAWVRGYSAELREKPSESDMAALTAYATLSNTTKKLK